MKKSEMNVVTSYYVNRARPIVSSRNLPDMFGSEQESGSKMWKTFLD